MIRKIKIFNYMLRLGIFTLAMWLMLSVFVLAVTLWNEQIDSAYYVVWIPFVLTPLFAVLTLMSCYRYEQGLDPEYSWKKRKCWVGF